MKTLIMCVAIAAAAFNYSSTELETYVAAKENVIKVAVVLQDDKAVCAVDAKPMFLASQRRSFIKQTEQELKQKFNLSEVIVTLDVDLFYDATAINKAILKGEMPKKRIEYIFSVARVRRNLID